MSILFKIMALPLKVIALSFRLTFFLLLFLWRCVMMPARLIERIRTRNDWGFYPYYAVIVLPPLAVYCASVEWINSPNREIANLDAAVGLICMAWACLCGIAFMSSDGNRSEAADPASEWPYRSQR